MAFLNPANIVSRKNRILLAELVRTDFKVRYQGSVLGYLWSLLRPLAMFAILYLVFSYVFNLGDEIENFPVYLLLGVVLWGFFVEATTLSIGSIVENGALLRKINIPPYILVISRTINATINLFFNLVVVGIFMFISPVDITIHVLWFIPILLELFVLALGVSFLLSALFVKYRDVSFIWDVLMQGAFYATPILYPLSLVMDRSELAAKLLMLNPMAQIIQDARHILVTTDTVTVYQLWDWMWIVPFILVGTTLFVAVIYFRQTQDTFTEEV